MKRIMPLLLIALLAMINCAFAAEEDGGLWATVAASKALRERVTAAMAVQLRFNDDIDRRERTLLRPSLSYRLDAAQVVTFGYDAHFVNAANDKVEQRLWQQYLFSHQLAQASASLRLRLEERFIDHVDGTPVRLRIKPTLKVPFDNSPWFFTISNEFFVSFNEVRGGQLDGFHENRAYAGFGRALGEGVVGQIGYQNQFIERAGRDVVTHQLFVGVAFKLPRVID